jgi:hypothetical protein
VPATVRGRYKILGVKKKKASWMLALEGCTQYFRPRTMLGKHTLVKRNRLNVSYLVRVRNVG